ncbi:hypothetical protein JYB62_17650 [Algoriphagus lutimaris]|uniref:DUF5683 domain-containing protein n=1 Tax=Algoriphagus lutimaris TaxID=613197 RepID=UPI00196A454D|nr:DUF5683 domain-containing protein [Algoriphagus lutimaris]MBN3521837.1 hypothetical protein [Algoriphagus lutimaris]
MGLLVLSLFVTWSAVAQEVEVESRPKSEEKEKPDYSNLPKNPRKATLMSAILPGAGQVYNNKAWKVPILYAGIMTDIYFIQFNNRRYQVFRQALFDFDDGISNDFPNLNREALVRNVDYWRRNRDLCFLLLAGIYALNLIDANVDAHLSGFDISEDLALGLEPYMETLSANNNTMGVSLKLKF